ncbi:MAG: hypothetical protein BGN92_08585 [Sphingobacteriales bacterium 41-5]|nr:MAG: hypothetical protein BGN92_08585 [Sphingobacteriales bacterium 41-5]
MENKTSTQNKPIDVKALKAAIFLKYRVELDDTSLIILAILTDQQNKTFNAQNKIISEATEKINDSQTTLQVDKEHPGWQAFAFGFGKFGAALIIAITILTVLYILYVQDKKENRPAMIEWYRNYYNGTKDILTKKKMNTFLKKYPRPNEDTVQ